MPEQPIRQLPASEQARVALTFDDGPVPGDTDAVVDVLAEAGVVATFFVVGLQCQRHPAVLRRVVEAGMSVGVHSWDHPDLRARPASFVTEQLQRTIDVLEDVGVSTSLFRPPFNRWDRVVIARARSLGLRTITGDVDSGDWRRPGSEAIAAAVLREAKDRSIIICHDGGGDRGPTVAALPSVIDGLAARGLAFVDLNSPGL